MYAVLMTGGKQYRVEAGSTLVVEKVGGEPGSSITFDRILLVGDGNDVTVGSPTVPGASVSATVLGEALGPKIVVFKFKQKVKYRRRTGHRQHLTRLRIDSISSDGKTVKAEPPEPEPAPKRQAARPKAAATAQPEEKPKPVRRRAAVKADKSAPEAKAEAAPAPRRSRERAAPKAEEAAEAAETAEKAPSPARARRPKASGEAASKSKADEKAPSAAEAKPRTRRTTKPKTESAKED
jgi:large subunit ribosomal protein L21